MAKKVLVVEDDSNIAELLRLYLEKDGFDVFLAADGGEGIRRAQELQPDLILLDIMLPVVDGWVVCSEVRKTSNVPIIMLTAKGETFDKISGLEMGADDYVTKPFSPKEVMARINAVTKRKAAKQKQDESRVIRFEGLEIDMAGRNVYVDGEKAVLTPKEYELLFYFVRNQGLALTREKLLYDVWGFDFYGDDRTVDTHVKMLRGNLKQYRKFIVTLRGLGYKFEADGE